MEIITIYCLIACSPSLTLQQITLTKIAFLTDGPASQVELLLARRNHARHGLNGNLLALGDVLEIGVQYALKTQDMATFERYMAQLNTYYYDYRYSILIDHPAYSQSNPQAPCCPSPPSCTSSSAPTSCDCSHRRRLPTFTGLVCST